MYFMKCVVRYFSMILVLNVDQVTSEAIFRRSGLFSELSFVTQYKILSPITVSEGTYRLSMNMNS